MSADTPDLAALVATVRTGIATVDYAQLHCDWCNVRTGVSEFDAPLYCNCGYVNRLEVVACGLADSARALCLAAEQVQRNYDREAESGLVMRRILAGMERARDEADAYCDEARREAEIYRDRFWQACYDPGAPSARDTFPLSWERAARAAAEGT